MKTKTQAIFRVVRFALDLLFPPECVSCGREGSHLCGLCAPLLKPLPADVCPACSSPLEGRRCPDCARFPLAHLDRIKAGFVFQSPARELVHSLKFNGIRPVAGVIASLLVEALGAEAFRADLLVPVPLHRRRERERGFNQSLLIARRVSEMTGVRCDPTLLVRVRETRPQVGLEAFERGENEA